MRGIVNSQGKFFNIAGPIVPTDHYHLPLRLDYDEVLELINSKYYFILHAPLKRKKREVLPKTLPIICQFYLFILKLLREKASIIIIL